MKLFKTFFGTLLGLVIYIICTALVVFIFTMIEVPIFSFSIGSTALHVFSSIESFLGSLLGAVVSFYACNAIIKQTKPLFILLLIILGQLLISRLMDYGFYILSLYYCLPNLSLFVAIPIAYKIFKDSLTEKII